MYTMKNYVLADSLEEAYTLLSKSRTNVILGGTTYLKMGNRNINHGIDLSKLQLNRITKDEQYIRIGAYVTLRDIEISRVIQEYANGILSKAVATIVGVQFRNVATIGASVYARYGFSDIIPSLLVLGAKVKFYQAGIMDLETYMEEKKIRRDILTEILLPLECAKGYGACDSVRKSVSDYAIVNTAVYCKDEICRIAIGARPDHSKLAVRAAGIFMNGSEMELEERIKQASHIAVNEMTFSSNMRGSMEYRKQAAEALVYRLLRQSVV